MTTMTATETRVAKAQSRTRTYYLIALAALVSIAAVRVIAGADEIDSQGSLRAAIIATCPIPSPPGRPVVRARRRRQHRPRGQMMLGHVGRCVLHLLVRPLRRAPRRHRLRCPRRPLHALATVTFGVDHIVSGVAINVIALGLTTFLAEAYFADYDSKFGHGGAEQLTGLAETGRDHDPRPVQPGRATSRTSTGSSSRTSPRPWRRSRTRSRS